MHTENNVSEWIRLNIWYQTIDNKKDGNIIIYILQINYLINIE